MRRADVCELAIGSTVHRLVIVSSNSYPKYPAGVPIRTDTAGTPGLITTGDGDPIRGVLDFRRVRSVDPHMLRARIGRMSPATMRRLGEALRSYFDLP